MGGGNEWMQGTVLFVCVGVSHRPYFCFINYSLSRPRDAREAWLGSRNCADPAQFIPWQAHAKLGRCTTSPISYIWCQTRISVTAPAESQCDPRTDWESESGSGDVGSSFYRHPAGWLQACPAPRPLPSGSQFPHLWNVQVMLDHF